MTKEGATLTTPIDTVQHNKTTTECTSWEEMDLTKDLRLCVLGLTIRMAIYHLILPYIPLSLQVFLIPPKYSLNYLRECHYLSLINSSHQNLNSFMSDCPHDLFLKILSPFLHSPFWMVLFASSLQYFTFYIISQQNRSIGLLSWLNPVSSITATLSPILSLQQFLFVTSVHLSQSVSPLQYIPLVLLCAMDLQYLPIAFCIISLPYPPMKSFFKRPVAASISFLLLASGYVYLRPSTLFEASSMKHFQPGPGIVWYLQGQIFPEYGSYFTWFLRLQPAIISLLLVFRLGEINPLATVKPSPPLSSLSSLVSHSLRYTSLIRSSFSSLQRLIILI
jgi:hypothetical protein